MAVQITGPLPEKFAPILTNEVMDFLTRLHKQFNPQRKWLLKKRDERQTLINVGHTFFNFLTNTQRIRKDKSWKVNPVPADIQKRWVEITGPASNAKMDINAMKSGANVYMADAEDSDAPFWKNILQGQLNLYQLIRRTLRVETPEKVYELKETEKAAVLFFRPRGWHLMERHALVDGEPMSASLFDFGMYFFHNAQELLRRGTGPYFYLPKMESHLEARLWNEVFLFSQGQLGIEPGTIKATVLIETLPAAFEMDEILYELREHSAGLNCGRWDYIFSYIKKLQIYVDCVLPDRAQVTMDKDFLKAYCELLVQTCHKRGAHAMGGMAAQIPIKNNPEANEKALTKVRADKEREVKAGHDGTWVAHPALVPVAMEIFEKGLNGKPNQLDALREDVKVTAEDLLRPHQGAVTEAGVRANVNVGILYIASWLRGVGAAALYNLMEDVATAEISRSQLWQWVRHEEVMDNGVKITSEYVAGVIQQELIKIRGEVGEEQFRSGKYEPAAKLLADMALSEEFTDFLTLPAYDKIVAEGL